MTLTQFAMIIKGPGYDPVTSRATINSPFFSTTVVCVSSFEEAIFVANDLVREGVQLIELCGGFTPDQADSLQASIGKHVPVGVVRYSSKEQQHLASLFGAPCA
jgi:hypothetical protein